MLIVVIRRFSCIAIVYTIVSVEVNIFAIRIYLLLDNEIDRKIDVTAILFLLVQNRQQTHY